MEKLNQRKKEIRKEKQMLRRKNNLMKLYWFCILVVLLILIATISIGYKEFTITEDLGNGVKKDDYIRYIGNNVSISYIKNESVLTLLSNISIAEEELILEEVIIEDEIEEIPILNGEEEEIIDDIEEYSEEIVEESGQIYYDDSLYGLNLEELFSYMNEVGKENNIPSEILQAMAKIESNFNPNAISSSNDHGLMQINACNFSTLRKMGINDFYNPYESVDAAIIIINLIRNGCGESKRNNWHYILMSYNMGQGNANRRWKRGQYSSSYSREVIDDAKKRGYIE